MEGALKPNPGGGKAGENVYLPFIAGPLWMCCVHGKGTG